MDDPAVADEKAALRDRNDIAKRGHPVLQGSPTAAHQPLAVIGRAATHVDRQFAIRYQAFDSPREIRRVGGGLRSSETQRQFVCAGTAVLRRLRYDLLGGTGERETRDEAVVEHSPGPLAPAQAVERADHLRPCDAAQPDDRFALRRPVVAGRPQRYQHRADSLFCNLPGLGAIWPRRARQILHDVERLAPRHRGALPDDRDRAGGVGRRAEVRHDQSVRQSAAQRETATAYFLKTAPELAEANREIDKLRDSLPKFATTLVLTERPTGHERITRRHQRGEYLQAKEPVTPGVPEFLSPLPRGIKADRLALARWLTAAENPLTVRVGNMDHFEGHPMIVGEHAGIAVSACPEPIRFQSTGELP